MSQSIIRSQEKGISIEQLSVLQNVNLFTTYERNSWSQFMVMRQAVNFKWS